MRTIVTAVSLALALLASPQAFTKGPPDGDLPPGLQKKADRGEPLPPGWQKKLETGHRLDDDVYHHGEVMDSNENDDEITVRVEGKLIKVLKDTHEIIDILDDY